VSPPRAEKLLITGPCGVIQAVVEDPRDTLDSGPAAFAVVCHPHPLHGGTMDNKVATTLARSFHELGVPTIRFNFRGVGESAGAHDEGRGEVDDALAAVAWGRARWPAAALWLSGFSFGGRIALAASSRPEAGPVARLVTIAPAFTRFHASPADVRAPTCPWLIVQGDADEVIPAAEVAEFAARIDPAPRVELLAGVGHFFHGNLNLLRDTILQHVRLTRA
jgi:alpha/beta superfamily hydrolase